MINSINSINIETILIYDAEYDSLIQSTCRNLQFYV